MIARTAGIAMPAKRLSETDRGPGPPSARVAAAEARARSRVRDYEMIGAGETVAVAASGGKDSNALIACCAR